MKNQHIKNTFFSKYFKALICLVLFLGSQSIKADVNLSEVPKGDYKLDRSHASIVWKVKHLGLSSYVARFTDFDMQLTLDADDISKSRVAAQINAASINTENERFNKDLIGDKWFKTEKFPTITFNSTAYSPQSETEGTLTGEIEMFGIKKPVIFDVILGGTVEDHAFIGNAAGIGFTASSVIKRSDWNFSKLSQFVGDEVIIEISAEFYKEKIN